MKSITIIICMSLILCASCYTSPRAPIHREITITMKGIAFLGRPYANNFSTGLRFELNPTGGGWRIAVKDRRETVDIAGATPHTGGADPKLIEGIQFKMPKPEDYTPEVREFIFSPEVGRTVRGSRSGFVSTADIEKVRSFGKGTFKVLDYQLARTAPDKPQVFKWMQFEAVITWKADEHALK